MKLGKTMAILMVTLLVGVIAIIGVTAGSIGAQNPPEEEVVQTVIVIDDSPATVEFNLTINLIVDDALVTEGENPSYSYFKSTSSKTLLALSAQPVVFRGSYYDGQDYALGMFALESRAYTYPITNGIMMALDHLDYDPVASCLQYDFRASLKSTDLVDGVTDINMLGEERQDGVSVVKNDHKTMLVYCPQLELHPTGDGQLISWVSHVNPNSVANHVKQSMREATFLVEGMSRSLSAENQITYSDGVLDNFDVVDVEITIEVSIVSRTSVEMKIVSADTIFTLGSKIVSPYGGTDIHN